MRLEGEEATVFLAAMGHRDKFGPTEDERKFLEHCEEVYKMSITDPIVTRVSSLEHDVSKLHKTIETLEEELAVVKIELAEFKFEGFAGVSVSTLMELSCERHVELAKKLLVGTSERLAGEEFR
jgi:hypothetical protein